MKKTIFCLSMAVLISGYAQSQTKPTDTKLKSTNDSLSYFIGLDLGTSLAENDLSKLDLQLMMKGIQDQFDKKPLTDVNVARQFIQDEMQRMAEAKALVEKEAGIKFLEDNKKKEGVQTTATGLQYKVIKKGDGIKPTATDTVEVHYHGTLPDGTVFDSSVERGEKVSFPLDQVIPGWTEGLQLMPIGSKYMFYIPENLAYGSRAMGEIKAYSTLIFEVELFNVSKSK